MSNRSLAPCVLIALMSLTAWPGAALAQRERAPTPRETLREEQTNVPQPRPEKQFPIGAQWTLVSLNGRAVSGERPSMLLDAQLQAKGYAGCNTYQATAYPLQQQGFVVGPIAVTKRACESGAMANETAFLRMLRAARKWDLVEGRLVLQGQAGELRFERAL